MHCNSSCFLLTLQGLEDQLLGEVVRQERPELEDQRDRLVTSIAADKRQLQDLEVSSAADLLFARVVGCVLHQMLACASNEPLLWWLDAWCCSNGHAGHHNRLSTQGCPAPHWLLWFV